MKQGFLGAPSRRPDPQAAQAADHDTTVHLSSGEPAAQPPATATPEQREAQLQQCLDLLRGPSDERRFVGLLLVTRALPAGDPETMRRVLEAVGFGFLGRLLLPLRAAPGPPPPAADPEGLQKQLATVRLGLAVLSSVARVPELAAGREMVEWVPLFLKVARAGGVASVLGPSAGISVSSAAAEHDADTASVVDALECALAVALACEEGRPVALESGALSAAAAVLQRGSSTVAGSGGGGERPLPDLLQACVLAVRLVTAVLGQGPPGEVLSGQEQEEGVLELVPALASLLALPALLLPPTRQPAGGQQAAQAPSGSGSSIPDLAALQLEALHALHLVLMRTVSEGCYAPLHVALAALARRTPRGGWPARAAAGLSLVLRGRVSPQERHAALQLAALLVELLGPEWLLGEAGGSGGAAGSQMGTAAGSAAIAAAGTGGFYQLLVEIVKVETSVLLLDALAPAAPVPLGGGRAAAPGAAALRGTAVGGGGGSEAEEGASASEGEGADEAAEQLDQMELDELEELSRGVGDEPPAALGGPGQPPPPPQRPGAAVDVGVLQDVLASEAQRQKLEERLRAAGPAAAAGGSAAEEEGAAGAAGAAGTGAPGGAAAAEAKGRERVDIVKLVDEMQLPAEYREWGPSEAAGQRAARLLPACFALVEACIEALAMDAEAAEGKGGQPVLADSVALRALGSLREVCEALLEFMEQTVGGQGERGEEAEAAGVSAATAGAAGGRGSELEPGRRALVAAAVRVVGRFCAEAPDAFGPRLRRLLPHLLAAFPNCGGSGCPLPFLLPLLMQQLAPLAGDEAAGAQAECAAWLEVLQGEEVFAHIARHVGFAAGACRSCHLELSPESPEEREAAGAQLMAVASLMLAIINPRDDAVDSLTARAVHAALPALDPLLGALETLLTQPRLSVEDTRLACTCGALCAALAAAELEQGTPQLAAVVAAADQHRTSVALLRTLGQAAAVAEQLAGGGLTGNVEDMDEALAALQQALDCLAAAAARLLPASPAFAAACRAHGWVQGALAGEGLLPALGGSGLQAFLGAVLAAQLQ